MQKIIGDKTIVLTRGDTLKLEVSMYYLREGVRTEYTPQEGDVVRFALKKHYEDTNTLIHKVIPNDTQLLQLLPTETKTLAYGDYVYDIEITYAGGDVDTFIDRATFRLTEEVE